MNPSYLVKFKKSAVSSDKQIPEHFAFLICLFFFLIYAPRMYCIYHSKTQQIYVTATVKGPCESQDIYLTMYYTFLYYILLEKNLKKEN